MSVYYTVHQGFKEWNIWRYVNLRFLDLDLLSLNYIIFIDYWFFFICVNHMTELSLLLFLPVSTFSCLLLFHNLISYVFQGLVSFILCTVDNQFAALNQQNACWFSVANWFFSVLVAVLHITHPHFCTYSFTSFGVHLWIPVQIVCLIHFSLAYLFIVFILHLQLFLRCV